MKKFFSWKLIVIIVVALLIGLFDAPNSVQKALFLPEIIQNAKIHLGLDLQGGSQLDYKIDLRKVPEADKESIVEGVVEIINKRVNNLGVAEPNIYTSMAGDEAHVIVELAELSVLTDEDVKTYLKSDKKIEELNEDEKKQLSLEKAKATVGKTIQLEFKEKKDGLDPQEKEKITLQAQTALDKIKAGESFDIVGQEESLANPGKVTFETEDFTFANDITPTSLKDAITILKTGDISKDLVAVGGSFILTDTGETLEDTGLVIVQLLETNEEIKFEKQVEASHVLIAWQGASNAAAEITRTEEEAYEKAKEALDKIKNQGKSFDTVAQYYSDDPGNKDTGGRLSKPVTGDGVYVYDFEQAALALEKDGDVSDIIKTEFGYHIIKANKVLNDVKELKYKYKTLRFSTLPDPWKETGLTGKHFVHADVQLDQFYQPYISIEFNDDGARLFEEITGRNVGKPVAIFVGGSLISKPKVNEKIAGGKAQITGDFSQEEANNLARDLNTGAIPAPVILTGEYTIGATLGQNALKVSIWAGLIGILVIFAFMILIYKLPGIFAAAALTIYTILLLFLIKSELPAWIALTASIAVFASLVYKTLNSKDATGEKFVTFILSCIILFFLTYALKTGIVLTLAGIAGIILSLGMAVDANILIFERIKEELRSGRSYKSAVEEGFFRAWDSIRDSNFSTLITCAILFFIGSSAIKGFAFNLAAGVLISMFTAITVTKAFMVGAGNTELHKNLKLFGVNPDKPYVPFTFKFAKHAKKWLMFSAILSAISIVTILIFGFRPGLDFTGGTLMELKFKNETTKEMLQETLPKIEGEVNTAKLPQTTEEKTIIEESEQIDLKNITITPTEKDSFIFKTKYISSETHDLIIKSLQEKLGEVTELRFTTVGPTVGTSMKSKALKALLIAVIAIILYVAFAFRKVPKEVNPWRFGIWGIIALIHDILISTGLFIIVCVIFNVEIDLLFITALLTILGYSINDTIIVFDRLRENLKLASRDEDLGTTMDRAINQTITRSINTTITTLITIFALFIGSFFGGAESVRYFLLALLVGITLGAYSSIFIATSGLILHSKWAAKRAEEKLRRA
ncbi:MAG: protein translocase subunit SecF [Candidatus Gracilibacteria bacterium]